MTGPTMRSINTENLLWNRWIVVRGGQCFYFGRGVFVHLVHRAQGKRNLINVMARVAIRHILLPFGPGDGRGKSVTAGPFKKDRPPI